MEFSKFVEGGTCNISLKGKFSFSDHSEFKNILSAVNSEPAVRQVNLNLKDLEYVDSAALGMMLLLKEGADKNSKKLVLLEVNGQVKKMFEVSRFYEIFDIK